MKYHIKEYVRGHWHVVDESGLPIFDGEPHGNDRPVVFTDPYIAAECAAKLNEEDEAKD